MRAVKCTDLVNAQEGVKDQNNFGEQIWLCGGILECRENLRDMWEVRGVQLLQVALGVDLLELRIASGFVARVCCLSFLIFPQNYKVFVYCSLCVGNVYIRYQKLELSWNSGLKRFEWGGKQRCFWEGWRQLMVK